MLRSSQEKKIAISWSESPKEIEKRLRTTSAGLTVIEAKARRLTYGPNTIQEGHHVGVLQLIGRQIVNPLILTLIIAGGVTGFLREWTETIVISVTVIVNTALGFWQEHKAQTILESLTSYIRTRVRVRRDGQEHEIDAADLVPGDHIHLLQGDRIPADARLIFANGLEVDESILTGESLSVSKQIDVVPESTPLAERTNMLHSGTLIIQGTGKAIVVATGGETEFGRIAALSLSHASDPTPLQRAVARFARGVGITLIILTGLVFLIGLRAGYAPLDIFLIAIALAVSAIPEGLPIALTVILAVGVERLAKKNGVVRKLLAAETLGSTSLILTDKTGTLTQARMTLSTILPSSPTLSEHDLLQTALLTTDALIENPTDPASEWRISGRPMEVALIQGAATHGILLPTLQAIIVDRLPFNSTHKYSLTVIKEESGYRSLLVGAPDIILSFTQLSEAEQTHWQTELTKRALTGERFLGVAWKTLPDQTEEALSLEMKPQGFVFGGLVGFRDPLRPRMKEVMQRIISSGVKTVIVTGDHRGTAEAIARSLGMMTDSASTIMTGEELRTLSEEALRARAPNVAVYARVTPEQKSSLVKLYQQLGHIVAVTGDGVNDAPALQAADIGVAVGSGTDVAKSAADLIILDNDFQTIVVAIEEGRRILSNIKKALVYLLSNSLDAILLIGGSLLMGIPLPLNALQILYVNLFTDSLPAISFAFEERANTGQRTTKISTVFDQQVRNLTLSIVLTAGTALFALYAFLLHLGFPAEQVRTFIFASFATHTLFITFCLRDLHTPIWRYRPFSNPWLTTSSFIGILLTFAAIYLPALQSVLGTIPLSPSWLMAVLGFGCFSIVCVETGKRLFRST